MALSDGVPTVDPQLGAGDVARRIAQEVGDGAHQILRLAHFALGDQRGPVLEELGVVVEDFGGPAVR